MKKIKILHLYYDLLNLYGETGNITAIKDSLESRKIKYDIDYLTIDDKIDFSKYDIVYVGDGDLKSISLAIKDIKKYKKDIKEYIENNKVFIATGETLNIFGKPYLNIFNFKSESITKEAYEVVTKCDFLDKPIIGFINKSSKNTINEDFLFDNEGIHYKNFFGSYMIGPLLIRNPHLLDYILSLIIKDYKVIEDTPDYKAYNEFIKNVQI